MRNLENILGRVRKSAELLELGDKLIEILTSFKCIWSCDLPVKIRGKQQLIPAVRVWHRSPHNDKPTKGGIRFHPNIKLTDMQAHAIEMSLKNWLMELPFGGAKGGVAIDPGRCSKSELKAITEKLVDELDERNMIGPYLDVPAPDVGTNPEIMNWIRQRFAQRRRTRETAQFAGVVTGKPVGYGRDGIPGREQATGYGLIEVLEIVLRLKRISPDNMKRVAIMGFGNVGANAARFLAQKGYEIIALGDVDGAVYRRDGFDPDELSRVKTPHELKAAKITNHELLELFDIDILLPAALENVITEENALHVKAKIILEGANGPTTPEADEILESREILVIPDILANAGGVTVSFFEWARNTGYAKDPRVPFNTEYDKSILTAMSDILKKAAVEVFEYSSKHQLSLRQAAYTVAIKHVASLLRDKYLV
ncbi:MAG: Glu/Leu/Phe/Val dehydrogenase [Candidatus Niyogibacteria bacterium]|nr:MAG: Glu/Leu/Phe/Val dehydrogenase [Candidatus Niyogibacteria bacterium]